MRLTLQTDYGFRILMYLGRVEEKGLVSAADIATMHRIPLNHVKKVITHLVKGGYILSVRGRSGGVKLALSADKIHLGDLIKYLDDRGNLLRCMDETLSTKEGCDFCILFATCALKSLLGEAKGTFVEAMNKYTLWDITKKTQFS
ncbi:Rrf2 family transcriptional regulator [Acetobacteraceae bacterium]|nr:Rrf2 family transcriptional regulator [Acetobacteraceae bacterium]